MQAIKNGIKTMLRTPGKTGLFAAVLLALSVLLATSFCAFGAVRAYLKDCDEYYHTVAELEYLGKDYPSDTVWDEGAAAAVEANRAALEALVQNDAVLSYESTDRATAHVTELHRADIYVYDPETAVLRVRIRMMETQTNAFIAQITQVLYAHGSDEERMILLRTVDIDDPDAPKPQKDCDYLVSGHFFAGKNGYPWFLAEEMTLLSADGETPVPAFTEVEGETPQNTLYHRLARQLAWQNDGVPLQRTAAVEDLLPFHQQELSVTEGRYFTKEEYDTRADVCIVTAQLAQSLKIGVDDEIDFAVFEPSGSLYGAAPETLPESRTYRVVGITNKNENYAYGVYLPDAGASGEIRPVNGYRLGRFRLKNDSAPAFAAAAGALEEQGFRVSVYDQGYAAAVEPMREMLVISAVFLAVCLLLALAVLCLMCHTFVSLQRETARTMTALGSGRKHVYLYFLSACALLSLPAAALGALVGRVTEKGVLRLMGRFVLTLSEQDLRFSASRVVLIRTLDFTPDVPAWLYLTSALTLLLGALGLTLCFSRAVLKEQRPKRRRKVSPAAPKRTGRSSHLKGKLKYAVLSIRRSPARTGAVLLLGVIAALFFGQLTSSLDGYQAQLDAVVRDSVLTGRACDTAGLRMEPLAVPRQNAETLIGSGLLENYNITQRICHIRFLGVPKAADGTETELPEPYLPNSAFGEETLLAQLQHEPEWLKTNDVRTTPLFYYADVKQIDWLEGWDETCFAGDGRVCAMPRSLTEKYGVQPGDTLRFLYAVYWRGFTVIDTVDLLLVARYVPATDSSRIYSPIGFDRLTPGYARGWYVDLNETGVYNSFLFTLGNAKDLTALRQAMADAGFTAVRSGGRGTAYAVIDDETFLNTTRSMERQIRYVGALYHTLYALAGVLAAVLAWLMTAARRQEIAVMRALGTQKTRIVGTFFAEQAVLCALGLLTGVLAWALTGHMPNSTQLWLAAAFFGLWALGALACITWAVRDRECAALTEPE